MLATALLAGCGRKLAGRYSGWLFVTSGNGRRIGVADLSQFRRVSEIPLAQKPAQVLRLGEKVFVTCPEGRSVVEIDPLRFRVARTIAMPGLVVFAAIVPNSAILAVLTDAPAALLLIDTSTSRVTRRIPLPGTPAGMDLQQRLAAITLAARHELARISLPDGRFLGATGTGAPCGAVRIRIDGKTILVGMPATKEIVTIDAATGAVLARLPLSFAPGRFCFNDDGGQMFVTGEGQDAIAIVNTFQNEVDQTMAAGRTPSAMAVADPPLNQLLVTNPGSGDLTIFDIDTRRLSASVHVGGNPGEVLITPDNQYALVIGRDSGDVAVVRLSTVLDRAVRIKPLFTVFPTVSNPLSAAIVPFQR